MSLDDEVRTSPSLSQHLHRRRQLFFLILLCSTFIVAGTAATTFTKWADLLSAPDSSGTVSTFDHPFFQTFIMFVAETLCLAGYYIHAYWVSKRRSLSSGERILSTSKSHLLSSATSTSSSSVAVGTILHSVNDNEEHQGRLSSSDASTSLASTVHVREESLQRVVAAAPSYGDDEPHHPDSLKTTTTTHATNTKRSRLWFIIPASLDLTATTLCNVALNLTSASSYQMLRGSVVFFTAVLSYFLLHRRFARHEVLGITIVISGLAVVGVSSSLRSTTAEASNPALGTVLVIIGQCVQACQFVLEEHWMKEYDISPMYLVGWEGVFGVGLTSLALISFQAFDGRPDDGLVALEQLGNCWRCVLATLGCLLSIPLLNLTANVITKELSAAARTLLDAVRIIFVWAIAMLYTSYFHESFDWLQMVGFGCIVLGSTIYRELLRIPLRFFAVSTPTSSVGRHSAVDHVPLSRYDEDVQSNSAGGGVRRSDEGSSIELKDLPTIKNE